MRITSQWHVATGCTGLVYVCTYNSCSVEEYQSVSEWVRQRETSVFSETDVSLSIKRSSEQLVNYQSPPDSACLAMTELNSQPPCDMDCLHHSHPASCPESHTHTHTDTTVIHLLYLVMWVGNFNFESFVKRLRFLDFSPVIIDWHHLGL